MGKVKYLILIVFSVYANQLFSQPWHYDFGTSTGSFSTASTISTTFLPTAPSGVSMVRIGSTGGSVNLENQIITFGNSVYFRGVAPTTTSANKIAVYDYTSSQFFTLRFKIRLGASDGSNTGAASGVWYLFIGDGATYSNASGFSGGEVFTGLRFTFGSSGNITANYRNGGSWVTLPSSPFLQGIDFLVEIYGNNSSATQYYTYGSTQTVASGTWDIWVNGVNIGNDLFKALKSLETDIDSYMFYGESSTGNVANIFLDDIDYTNSIASTPLPVVLSSFTAYTTQRSAYLTWSTSEEINNAGFDIERYCIDANSSPGFWQKSGFVNGNGTTSEEKIYVFEDKSLNSGNYKYRLKQTDYNGNFEYFELGNPAILTIGKPDGFFIGKNYPNPSNPSTKIDFQLPVDGNVKISVFDITGRETAVLFNGFLNADFHTVKFDGSGLASGIYFYSIYFTGVNGETYTKTQKMILVK